MLRFRFALLCLFPFLTGCAWSYQQVQEQSVPQSIVPQGSAPPVLANISERRSQLGFLPVAMANEIQAVESQSPVAANRFPDVNATDADWRTYWNKRFPQTNVFSKTPEMTDDWFYRWDRHYYSAGNRPVETMRLGDGATRVMVVGSLHGNEPNAIYLAEQLARHIGNKPVVWKATSTLVLRNPNPDGEAAKLFTNSKGVDLNRNFPTKDFRTLPDHRTGARAGSEVETQILCRILTDFAPQRVVHIKSAPVDIGWVIHNKAGKSTAIMMGDPLSLKPDSLDNVRLTGSLESYVTDNLQLEMITIVVPRRIKKEDAWRTYREPLLTAITWQKPAAANFAEPSPLSSKFPAIKTTPTPEPKATRSLSEKFKGFFQRK